MCSALRSRDFVGRKGEILITSDRSRSFARLKVNNFLSLAMIFDIRRICYLCSSMTKRERKKRRVLGEYVYCYIEIFIASEKLYFVC